MPRHRVLSPDGGQATARAERILDLVLDGLRTRPAGS
jgi:hypothetical protein